MSTLACQFDSDLGRHSLDATDRAMTTRARCCGHLVLQAPCCSGYWEMLCFDC